MVLGDIHAEIQDYLTPRAPRFTKPLAPGVAFAEDPGDGQSFGIDRCERIARSVLNAVAAGAERDRLPDIVEEDLRQQGYPLGRLHLNPDTMRDYSIEDYTNRRQGNPPGRPHE